MTEPAWTDERVGKLKVLFAAGLSMSSIAADLGHGITRNAVIGKVHRLHLSRDGAPRQRTSRTTVRQADDQPRGKILRGAAGEQRRLAREAAAAEFDANEISVIDLEIRSDRVVTIENLAPDDCHWPIGDPLKPGFSFCGNKPKAGRPYCAAHCRIAFVAPDPRRRAPARA